MLNILLSILCSVVIANLLMVFNRGGKYHILPIFLGNYLMAGVFSYLAIPAHAPLPGVATLLFGAFSGLLFLMNFLAYQRNILLNGLSLSVSVMRIAMIVPILVSLLLFREHINAWNGLGILLGISAFMLKSDWGGLRNLLWLVWLFAISGVTDLSLKVFKELGSGSEQVFVFMIFSSAFVFTLVSILYKRVKIPWQSIVFGLLLGLPNRFSTVFFLKGLNTVPAAIAYPVTAIGVVLISILSDVLFWRRRLVARDIVMYAVLSGSILLLNL